MGCQFRILRSQLKLILLTWNGGKTLRQTTHSVTGNRTPAIRPLAVWWRGGNTLVQNGEYVGLPCERGRRKRRDLAPMCDDVQLTLSTEERRILTVLSDI